MICLLSHIPTAFAFGLQNYPNLFFDASTIVNNEWFNGIDSRWAKEMSEYWAQTLIQYGPWCKSLYRYSLGREICSC